MQSANGQALQNSKGKTKKQCSRYTTIFYRHIAAVIRAKYPGFLLGYFVEVTT